MYTKTHPEGFSNSYTSMSTQILVSKKVHATLFALIISKALFSSMEILYSL